MVIDIYVVVVFVLLIVIRCFGMYNIMLLDLIDNSFFFFLLLLLLFFINTNKLVDKFLCNYELSLINVVYRSLLRYSLI